MTVKKMIMDYTETEFLKFVENVYTANTDVYKTEEEHSAAIDLFEELTEHPDGSDLLYYPRDDREDSPEGVVKEVKEWRAANGKPGFKSS